MTTVADQIAAARAAASALAAQQVQNTGVPTVMDATPQPGGGYAVPAPVRSGPPMDLDDLMSTTFVVDKWLKVNEHGLQVGTDRSLITDPFEVVIDMAAVQGTKQIKFGKPAQYFKSIDGGLTATTGLPWQEILAMANRVQPGARDYSSADVPMQPVKDIVVKGNLLLEAGKTLGYSLSTTGFKFFASMYKGAKALGLQKSKVRVEIFFEPQSSGPNHWGVVTFKLLGAFQPN